MSDPRKTLLDQIAALRSQVDPDLLDRARLAAEGKVPFDRLAARDAVRAFLDGRADGGRFKKQLVEQLKRYDAGERHELPPPGTKPQPHPAAPVQPRPAAQAAPGASAGPAAPGAGSPDYDRRWTRR